MSIRALLRPLGLALLGTLALAACGDDLGSDSAYQKDSFSKPTEHGELVFTDAVRNEARFTEENRFHSWTFTLTDDAAVDLQTDPQTVNLDTVMYLYKRLPGDELWGSYIRKNDNHDGEMYSRIKTNLKKGEYRVKVKATHVRMVGDFNVLGTCAGDGCPVVEAGVCEPTYGKGTYTEGCGERIRDVVMAPVTSESNMTIQWGTHCDHENVVAQAATAYRSYYGDWFDWDDYVGDDGDMYVSIRKHGTAGTVVGIDLGGDEDHVSFLFDAGGKLLVYFHSEQSSSTWYTCGADGEATMDEPDTEECGQALLHELAHSSASTTSGTTTADDAEAQLDVWAAAGVTYWAAEQGLAGSDAIEYSVSSWETGAEVQLSAGGASTSLLVTDRWGDTLLAMRTDGDMTRVMCEELNNE